MVEVQITTPILDAQGWLATPSVLSQIDARADARVKVRVPDSGTAGQVLQRTATGTAWADAPKGGSALVLSGPGRPDVPSTTGGVITGAEPVGAEYRSTDGANVGAYTWQKRPGGAWAVTDGDTGWRSIDYAGPSTILGLRALRIRRDGATVQATIRIGATGTGFVEPVYELPAGLRFTAPSPWGGEVEPWARMGRRHEDTGTFYLDRVNGGQKLSVYIQAAKQGTGSLLWHTDDPWPSTLPGTPA